jgi:hypothetical protein
VTIARRSTRPGASGSRCIRTHPLIMPNNTDDFGDRVPDHLVDADGWGPAGRALLRALGLALPSPESGIGPSIDDMGVESGPGIDDRGQAGARSASAPARAFKRNVTRAVRAAQAAGIEVGSITVAIP